jgi:hypothetical protein
VSQELQSAGASGDMPARTTMTTYAVIVVRVGAREMVHHIEVAFEDDGQIVAWRNRIHANIGALGSMAGWGMSFVAGMAFPGPTGSRTTTSSRWRSSRTDCDVQRRWSRSCDGAI